jgi:hypothetical protein
MAFPGDGNAALPLPVDSPVREPSTSDRDLRIPVGWRRRKPDIADSARQRRSSAAEDLW